MIKIRQILIKFRYFLYNQAQITCIICKKNAKMFKMHILLVLILLPILKISKTAKFMKLSLVVFLLECISNDDIASVIEMVRNVSRGDRKD